ncbi:MAG: M48 family metalloprotease, partial [Acetatifactor sp.]|nr:M48 family metalloprotease [Acetatifactor sp.]
DRLCGLLEENGCTVREIKVMDGSRRSTKANAYFSGFGSTKTIVLYDTLLEQMSADEIVAVFAHEMGHNKHKDNLMMQMMSLINLIVMVLLVWALVSVPDIYGYFGFDRVNYGFAFYLLGTVCLSFLSPFLGLFSSALSRRFEYRADRFAKERGYGGALISALKVLARNSFVCLSPHPLLVMLTYSHPTVSQRIEELEHSGNIP